MTKKSHSAPTKVSVGIATYLEAEFAAENTEKSLFIKTVTSRSEKENKKILGLLRDMLDSEDYNYDEMFFDGNEELPRWSGYSLGYYLVKKYLEKTNKKIEHKYSPLV